MGLVLKFLSFFANGFNCMPLDLFVLSTVLI
jgi:hypothetical protein